MSKASKILVIEDNTEVREILEEILELSDYDVTTAEDGTVGVKKALQDPPDLIICDVMMPKLDGYGVLNILSKKPATAAIPFIFLTAKSEKEDLRRGMNLGADDYITKPFYKDELLQVIETRLKKTASLQTKFSPNEQGLSAFLDEAKATQALNDLSENREVVNLDRKDVLIEEGKLPRYLYYVQSGNVKLYKTSDYGKEFIIKVVSKGEFIGYTPLIENKKYEFSVMAIEPSVVRLIPAEDFTKLLYANRDVSIRFIKMLAANITDKEEQLLQLAYNSVRKRVADTIIKLYENNGGEPINVLRDDLGQMVATAKESVIRMLSEFKSDGYIKIKDGVIEVIQLEKLKNVPG